MTSPLPPDVFDELDASVATIASHLDGRSVAVSQEWIGARAGSEKVFEALAVLLPDAELFTLSHAPGVQIETGGRPITTSFLDRAGLRDRRSIGLPLMPLAWRSMRRRWDVVVTSTHALGRSFGSEAGTHLSYVHSPARYVWFPEIDQRSASKFSRMVQAPGRAILKPIDRRSTRATDSLAANSATTQARIMKVYGRTASVIHPPVDTTFYTPPPSIDHEVGERSGLIALGRLIPYKQMDTAIEVAHRLGMPLTVVGHGPDLPRLERLATTLAAEVDFVTDASDDDVRHLYRTSEALLFPGNEDFGIVPVEAQACGCPVVTAGVGGALETVVDGRTGVHGASDAIDDLVAATSELLASPPSGDACRSNAERFSYEQFGAAVAAWIGRTVPHSS